MVPQGIGLQCHCSCIALKEMLNVKDIKVEVPGSSLFEVVVIKGVVEHLRVWK